MEDFILKDFAAEIKAVEGERALNVTITTNTVDRSGDIVEPKGGKLANFRKNPVVLMAHNYTGLPIGKASNLEKTENGINARVTFPEEGVYPLADTVYNMYKQKYMRAWSIGFIPIKSEDIVDEEDEKKMSRGRRFKTWELLEFSACSVPNNPDVSTNMVKKGIDVKPLEEAGFITIVEEKTKYNCECIKCKYRMTSEKHCKDIKCPKCGGTMRRVERPGPGEETNMVESVITKPEETDDFIRIPAKGEEGKHKGHKIRWITVSEKEGIRGIYCIDCKKIITYVFEKKKGWTMEKAKKWMKDHEKMVCDYFEKIDWDVEYIEEEIDWEEVKASIEKDTKIVKVKYIYMDEEGNEIEKEENILSVEGKIGYSLNDIYDIVKENKELKEKLKDLELKAGAVLNAKNKKNLKDAQALIQLVLDSAGEEEGQEGESQIFHTADEYFAKWKEALAKEEKDNKKDDTVISITKDKKEDPRKDEAKDEKKITVDEKVIAKAVTKALNYTLGITDK